MRKGFTLAEVLITLGIIGIVAALVLPAINVMTPDKNKAIYLKTYDTLVDIVNKMAYNTKFFPLYSEDDEVNYEKIPFSQTSAVRVDNVDYLGNEKFCRALALYMDGKEVTCNNEEPIGDAAFELKNGMRFWVVNQESEIDIENKTARYETDIWVDIDPSSDSKNCRVGDCEHPDIYKFLVAADGRVFPGDTIGEFYLKTRQAVVSKEMTFDKKEFMLDDKYQLVEYE